MSFGKRYNYLWKYDILKLKVCTQVTMFGPQRLIQRLVLKPGTIMHDAMTGVKV